MANSKLLTCGLTHQKVLMVPQYRHAPIVDPDRKCCPVCNHSVYSLAGIHPQCAIKLLDGPPKPKKKAKVGNATRTAEHDPLVVQTDHDAQDPIVTAQ
jgi:hypothetical protein